MASALNGAAVALWGARKSARRRRAVGSLYMVFSVD